MSDLQVVWPKPWIADAFEECGLEVERHTGLDIVQQNGPIWWATEHAAKSLHAGNRVDLTAPDARLVTEMPRWAIRRKMGVVPLKDAYRLPGPVFLKSANSKITVGDAGRAEVVDVAQTWADKCMRAGVPRDLPIIWSEPVEFTEEWRCWYDGTLIREISQYQRYGSTWNEWPQVYPTNELLEFAVMVAHKLVKEPCVLDVGYIAGRPAVVETNPVWSSGPYTSSYDAIYASISASYDWALKAMGTRWVPDEWLVKQANNGTRLKGTTNVPEVV